MSLFKPSGCEVQTSFSRRRIEYAFTALPLLGTGQWSLDPDVRLEG